MQSRVDVRKGVRAVDGWLAGAQQVEIRTMENENRTRRRVGRGHIWLLETIVTRVRATFVPMPFDGTPWHCGMVSSGQPRPAGKPERGKRHMKRATLVLMSALVLPAGVAALAQNNWVHAGQDPGATKFSTLDPDHRGQRQEPEARLDISHRRHVRLLRKRPASSSTASCISARQNGVFALDAATGKQIWKYETTGTARRGPLYWPGGNGVGPRIFSQTENGMAAIDPKTGNAHHELRPEGVHPRPADVVAAGRLQEHDGHPGRQLDREGVGHRDRRAALDAEPQGAARRSERETWLGDSLKTAGGPGLWGYFSVDVERGLLYVPVEKVGNDYYGGPHHGNNLYSDCLLAVDIVTGKIKWYQQLVHHDIWDFDLAAAPALVECDGTAARFPASR